MIDTDRNAVQKELKLLSQNKSEADIC
jgi:hypothetical protein